jgi:hypothetical protein
VDSRELFPGELERIDYLSVSSPASLEEMCAMLTQSLDLPPFEFGGEDDYDYAFSVTDGVEYNISRACGEGALRTKGVATPDGANFLVTVSLHHGRPIGPTAEEIVAELSRALAEVPSTMVLQSRAWKRSVGDAGAMPNTSLERTREG